MNKAFEALCRSGTGLPRRLLVLSLACLPVLLLISWGAVGMSKAAAWLQPHPPPAQRVDPEIRRLRSAAHAGDIVSERLLVATLVARYEAAGDDAALGEAFDQLLESWTSDAAFDPEAAQAYFDRYCGRATLAWHPICNEGE